MGTVEAFVFVAARVCAWATSQEVWKRIGAGERADPGAFAGKYLEPGVEQHLSAHGFAETAAELRLDEDPAGAEDRCAGHGEVRREFLYIAGICAAARYVLGTVALYQTGGPGRGVPRERLGRGFQRRSADQDVHSGSRRGFSGHSPRTGAQLLSARVHESAGAVSGQRE